jgi:hypothetical protein
VIDVQAKEINWFALVGGTLILVVLVISIYFPWWQLIIGENLATVNASPVNTNFGMLGVPFTIPLIWALNIVGTLIFLTSGIAMLVYSVTPTKSYSKELLSFSYKKPLLAVIGFVVSLLIITYVAGSLGFGVPIMGSTSINLPSNLIMGVSVSASISGSFQLAFLLAIVAAALCITARIYDGRRKFGKESFAASSESNQS